jgi:hypothetical protein
MADNKMHAERKYGVSFLFFFFSLEGQFCHVYGHRSSLEDTRGMVCLNNLALCYCLNEVYRWGLIVFQVLPFVVTVHAIAGASEIVNARKQVFARKA